MIGQTVSHYKILEKLGEGGMGVVYKAHDTTLDRTVALKFLPNHLTSDKAEKDRFYHEARAAAALTHQNIAVIHEIGEHAGQVFIVMECVEGKTLREILVSQMFTIKQVLDISVQIAEGLAAAHDKGIVHRDIKPENIIITPKGQAKITDFGLAKLKGATKLTRAGSTLGTAAYMSPEQARGDEVDKRSDIFSLGVVVYEMLAGKTPFRGEHHAALLYSIINEQPTPLARYNEKVPPELEHVVMKALTKETDERYQHADDMLADLRSERKKLEYARSGYIKEGEAATTTSRPVQPVSAAPTPKRAWRGIAIGGATLVLLAIVGISVFFFIKSGKSINSLAVLPFMNVGADPNTEYLSYGISRTLTDNLSQLASLKVKSQLAVSRYKEQDKDPLEIGKKLNVDAVLTGSVELRDQSLIVTVELSEVSDGNQLWGQTYRKNLSDIYLIQEEISKDVTDKLKIRVSGTEEKKLTKRYTENAEAYQDYLKGIHFRFIETRASLEKAVSYFQQALEKEPGHALAYAGLAEAYFMQEIWAIHPDTNKANAAARRAFELDPSIPETNIALGIVREFHDLDWKGSEQLFRNAIELNPNHWEAHYELGELLWRTGQLQEAEKEALRSVELQPLSVLPYDVLGDLYYSMGRYQMAVEQLEKAIEIDSGYAAEDLGLAYLATGKYEEARRQFERLKSPLIGCYYAAVGRKEDALKEMEAVTTRMREPLRSYYLTYLYSYIGDKQHTIEQLENHLRLNPLMYAVLRAFPFFDKLRLEPGYIALMKKAGLEK